ncbi:MAG: LysR family transcriptional regulator, partial [Clostridia bacterium]|nr:LysR family transcriptional regulator [Clostridia bacterium]
MDIKTLRNFVEIVDSGSLTAASKKLFIAQPALSNQLKALEKEMNTTLIERNSRHQKLTDAGKLFYERAKSIILLENAMFSEISDT